MYVGALYTFKIRGLWLTPGTSLRHPDLDQQKKNVQSDFMKKLLINPDVKSLDLVLKSVLARITGARTLFAIAATAADPGRTSAQPAGGING